MKRLLLVFTLVAMLFPASVEAQKRHRAASTSTTDTIVLSQKDDAVEAYSDTASYAQNGFNATEDDTVDSLINAAMNADTDDSNDLFDVVDALWHVGSAGVVIVIFILLITLFIFAIPIILIILLVRHLWKSHDDKAILEKLRMEQAAYRASSAYDDKATTPNDDTISNYNDMKEDRKRRRWNVNIDNVYDEYMFRKGIRNISIGVGLSLMFWFFGAEPLIGVGLLIACMGAGQLFISRTKLNKDSRKDDFDNLDDDPSYDK